MRITFIGSLLVAALSFISSTESQNFIASSNHGSNYKASSVKASSTSLKKSSSSAASSNQGSYVRSNGFGVSAGQYNNRAAARADSLDYNHKQYSNQQASGSVRNNNLIISH